MSDSGCPGGSPALKRVGCTLGPNLGGLRRAVAFQGHLRGKGRGIPKRGEGDVAKINWDEVFKRYTKDKVLLKSYSEIARELGVTVTAVRNQFKKRGVIDPRRLRVQSSNKSSKTENNLKLELGGAGPGNTNALKHGLYAKVFWTKEGRELYLKLVQSGEFPDPLAEVRLLQAKIASGEISKLRDVLSALEIMSRLYDKAAALARTEIERERLKHEAERVSILREKLELEKEQKHLSDEDEVVVEIGESDEDNDQSEA